MIILTTAAACSQYSALVNISKNNIQLLTAHIESSEALQQQQLTVSFYLTVVYVILLLNSPFVHCCKHVIVVSIMECIFALFQHTIIVVACYSVCLVFSVFCAILNSNTIIVVCLMKCFVVLFEIDNFNCLLTII